MDNSGEIAERVVRLSMDGAVYATKITGTGTKHLVILLHTILSDQNKTSGKIKLASMLKSGKELKVFTISEKDLQKFAAEAKRYGVTYCALRDKNPKAGHPIEIMVKAEDASKVARIFEKLEFGKVDVSTIETEIEKSIADATQNPPEQSEIAENENIENEAPIRKDGEPPENPFVSKTEKSPPSEDISKKRETEGKDLTRKKSVRKEIEHIKRSRSGKEKAPDSIMADREKQLNPISSSGGKSEGKVNKDKDGR